MRSPRGRSSSRPRTKQGKAAAVGPGKGIKDSALTENTAPVAPSKAAAAAPAPILAAVASWEDEFADIDRIDVPMKPAVSQSAAVEATVTVAAPAVVSAKSVQESQQRDQAQQQQQQHPQQVQQQPQVRVQEIDLQQLEPESFYAAKARPQAAAGNADQQQQQQQHHQQQQQPLLSPARADTMNGLDKQQQEQAVEVAVLPPKHQAPPGSRLPATADDPDEGLEIAAGKGLGHRPSSPESSASEGEAQLNPVMRV